MPDLITTAADTAVRDCLEARRSFALIAGAGSGKTTSLIEALEDIRTHHARTLRQQGQRIACITYTKRAVEVISSRLGFDELYLVSTLHSFLWSQIDRFNEDIREALTEHRIPSLLSKEKEKDNGRDTKTARKARANIQRLEAELAGLAAVREFSYDDTIYSDYLSGRLNHDDVIEVAGYLLAQKPVFRRLLGLRFPYIFVDEAQDTFQGIVDGLNLTCSEEGLPLVGYFGDPWQQIYDDRAGNFAPPENGQTITKTENFRCSVSVVSFLNAFRDDITQFAAGSNQHVEGSVEAVLIQSETPEASRKRYSEEQIVRALQRMDHALDVLGWRDRDDVIRLFLARQMIARRLGFAELHQLFTGTFASQRAQQEYEEGEHFLLKPLIEVVSPLMEAHEEDNSRVAIDILRRESPKFDVQGPNSSRPLREMIDLSNLLLESLAKLWNSGTIREILAFCRENQLLRISDRLAEQLDRQPRPEEYSEEEFGEEKGDWLVDRFLEMKTGELRAYCEFLDENTAYSTQHGVKGEEYPNVLVVYDDIEAAWNNYSFGKLLTPRTLGDPTEGQLDRGRKLAYVCFSRAMVDLRILLFTPNPIAAQQELIKRGLLQAEQIRILQPST